MNYKDASLSIEARTEHLLGLMTLQEKAGQLVQLFGWKVYERHGGQITLTESFKEEAAQGKIGSLYGVLRADPWTEVTLETGLSPREGAETMNAIQRYAIEHSRLGIPILFGEECSHGHMAIGATVFPVPLSLASAWNLELYERICRAIALETRSQGGAATYSPVLDVVRDPRWGRTEETYGEDPYLASVMAEAAVRGLQGERLDADDSVVATLKHFAGYGSSEGGRNSAPVHMGLRELHEVDLKPFRAAVRAGAKSVMTAYNEIDGIPCTSDPYLLTDVLRKQWGFDGFVITDCGAINMLVWGHDTAASPEEAAAAALKAGVDMEMSGDMFRAHLEQAVLNGRVDMAVLDEAVSRILRIKFELGLFERPYVDPERAARIIGSREHAALARQAALEGIVLLKNKDRMLPLSKDGAGKIAVIGPNADNMYNQLGDYTSPQPRQKVSTVLDGIRNRLAHAPERVLYAPGCRIKDDSREGFDTAVETAAKADVVVLVLGGSSARDFGEGTIDLRTGASIVTDSPHSDMDCGEGIDRATLALSGVQRELAEEIAKLGKPLVVVYINGRPVAEPWIDEHADAILEAWYPGQEGGNALADLLFGDANPSGRLTVSIPKDVGQLPVRYNGKRTTGRRYLETDTKPSYPFGYGLSYTEFEYGPLSLSDSEIAANGYTRATVCITNKGGRVGAETVQLYIGDKVSSVTRPEKELKGFAKVFLAPGETREVTFEIGAEQLSFVGRNLEETVEEGEFDVMVGPHSADVQTVLLRVRGV
ncbi:glycoside hydrolase family 3 N-terminal domain-containing protein [Paenibacillus sp. FSL W8-0194]|uniref:glycoside hydrolase family 3 N-terminal domain-containing protein n=1 Tax=Paenibacillus sp. FSL W8-0194 TaxID=2921711 RepID=UPI0030D8C3DC